MTYIPRRDITDLIPNKFEAIRVLALECRRLNEEIRAREDTEVEGKLTTLAVKQMLEGKVTYYDAKERREQERSEAMLSAAEGLLDIAELYCPFPQSKAFHSHVLVVHQNNQLRLPFQTIFQLHQYLIFPDRVLYQADRKQAQTLLPLISGNI